MTTRLCRITMQALYLTTILFVGMIIMVAPAQAADHVAEVEVISDNQGHRLQVDGQDFIVNGMNWDYFPIGTNYSYSLWNQPDHIIEAALAREMSLLKGMGVNTIRMYTGVQPKWVQYIYEEYGIYTVLNHSFGRYGFTIDGVWVPNVNYGDPVFQKALMAEVMGIVKEYQDVPGLLMWLLGNENNYGLFWEGAETEDIPVGETRESVRARHMYALFNDAIHEINKIDTRRPVAICNGDLLFIDIIAEEVDNLEILGSNVYRGISFTDFFDTVKEKLDVPVIFTEFGADAFNAREIREDQESQTKYLLGNWQEIYENVAGKGKAGNSIGGLTFQFSDGWWKFGQTSNLDVHDINASWANGGYLDDLAPGQNNMNEEWFGICAKGPTDIEGLYQLYPRAAYYALQEVHSFDPYAPGVDLQAIQAHFQSIQPMTALLRARGDKAALASEAGAMGRLSGLRIEMETYNTGAKHTTTPEDPVSGETDIPISTGFDHMQSYYVSMEATPSPNVTGTVTFNVLGHVARNLIDEIYYEKRGRPRAVLTENGTESMEGLDRLRVYNAGMIWEDDLFRLEGFFRTGHYHWGYEGDFFGLYREANYGPNMDTYDGNAPLGIEIAGKSYLNGFKLAFGPELWWGANPAYLLKYSQTLGKFNLTGIYQEDLDRQAPAISSYAVPLPPTKKGTIHVETMLGGLGVELGGIWSGATKVDETFQVVRGEPGDYEVLQDTVRAEDAYGAKFKLTYSLGSLNWYLQGAAMGIVADAGPTATQTFAGWRLKDSGSGNQNNIVTGFTYQVGSLQIAPNFLWQKPLIGPVPSDIQQPGRPRNVISDPFAVRGNRETTAYELLLTYDPTPETWMYEWNNDFAEDARFAASLDYVYREQPTTQDAAIGIFADGRTTFAFPGAPPARDLWELNGRIISKLSPRFSFILNFYNGLAEANGSDTLLVERYGGDLRFVSGSTKLMAQAKVNDWGPYDYHRDYNLTFPLQLVLDLSTTVGNAGWWELPQTRIGISYTYRTLDSHSPRYCPTKVLNDLNELECAPNAVGFSEGNEWQLMTYMHLNIGL